MPASGLLKVWNIPEAKQFAEKLGPVTSAPKGVIDSVAVMASLEAMP
jgi:hypothetical protein